MIQRAFYILLFTVFLPSAAHADCANPEQPEQTIVYNTSYKALQYSDGANWIAMHAPGSGSGGCNTATAGTKPEGQIFYNTDHHVMQACAGNQWKAMGPVGGTAPIGPTGCPAVADVCSDGSVYAGLSPDGNVKMYTTPADAGQFTWNNGTTNWIDTAMANSSYVSGEANTALLVGLADAASPYEAAICCDGLSAHGHNDWNLPASDTQRALHEQSRDRRV